MGEAFGDAAETTAASVLESVVVYASGAVCVRRARCALPASGGATVRIAGLPAVALPHSLRARLVAGPPGLRVTDVRLDLTAELRRSDQLPALRLDVEDAEDTASRLGQRCERLRAEIAEVAAFRAEAPPRRRGDPPHWAPVESILTLAAFVDSRLAVLHERLSAAEEAAERAGHEAEVLAHRLAAASAAQDTDRARPYATAVLALAAEAGPDSDPDAGAAGLVDAELELEYHVPGATWLPVYQLRLSGGGSGDTALVMRACVAQRTGEDWTGVRLGLSTADLMRRADLPELRSLRIGRSQDEPPAHGWREPPGGLAELFTGYDTARAARPLQGLYLGSVDVEDDETAAVPAGGPWRTASADLAGGGGYGAPPPSLPPQAAPPPAPAAPGGPPPPVTRSAAPRARYGPAVGGAVPEPEHAPAGPADPADDLLDYARLTLAGPEDGDARGTLRPDRSGPEADVSRYRRRAEAVLRIARPEHAADVRACAGAFDYRFDTAAPVDVASDGVWHTVPVCEIAARTEPAYVCVPAVDPAVYGTVLVTNTSPHALLAGPADVVVDGDFVLTAALPTLAPGATQAVGTGVVESLRVARRTRMRESTAGLRGGTTVLDHTVEIDVANRLPHPVTVEIRERVPVSADKDVRVEEHRATPPWTAPDAPLPGQDDALVRGARVWRVPVPSGGTTTLTGGYEIRLPAGRAVIGGNRRN